MQLHEQLRALFPSRMGRGEEIGGVGLGEEGRHGEIGGEEKENKEGSEGGAGGADGAEGAKKWGM